MTCHSSTQAVAGVPYKRCTAHAQAKEAILSDPNGGPCILPSVCVLACAAAQLVLWLALCVSSSGGVFCPWLTKPW